MSNLLAYWIWYLLAFVVGAIIAWVLVNLSVPATNEAEALAEFDDYREVGGN